MRFLDDMGVDVRVVEWLRGLGHDAVHLWEQGLHRAVDEVVFAKALAEHRIVLTFDLDFGDLAAFAGNGRAQVILFRQENARTPHVIERLSAVLEASTDVLQRSVIVIVEETRHRVRFLPIGEVGDWMFRALMIRIRVQKARVRLFARLDCWLKSSPRTSNDEG